MLLFWLKWILWILRWLFTNKSSPDESSPPQASLAATLDTYQTALKDSKLLPALLARDRVESALQQTRPIPPDQFQRLVQLDNELRKRARAASLNDLPDRRQTRHPSDAHWWWFLDQEAEKREAEKDLLWVLLTGTLLILTTTLAIEIIKRFWASAPDIVSIGGTLLTLLITGSPLFKRGQELAKWLLKRVPRLEPRFHAEAMAGMASLALVIVLIVWLLLPQLALLYNRWGYAALDAGNLTIAQRHFQRAVALNPDLEVPYYNLADVYQQIGRPDEALAWYQKAIERDRNFGLAYGGLGHLYNLQGEFTKAEQVLLAGLRLRYDEQDAEEIVTRYALLSDLGWTYFAQERYERAQETLEAAVALEGELKTLEESTGRRYRSALPHYYLAQLYEHLEQPDDAYEQWEACLRLLDQTDWANRDWFATAQSHLKQLEKDKEKEGEKP